MQKIYNSDLIVGNFKELFLNEISNFSSVLVVCSKSVNKEFDIESFFYDRLGSKTTLYFYDTIERDVPFSCLDGIISSLGRKNIDIIIAIGGGAVIDACKVLSLALAGCDYKKFFNSDQNLPGKKVPLYVVPSLPGSGAETSIGAIIFDDKAKVKGGLRGALLKADKVYVDASLFLSCPKRILSESMFDCLAHAIETYISLKSTEIVRDNSLNVIKYLFNNIEAGVDSSDLIILEQFSFCSAIMGYNLANSSTCLPHRIQYILGPMTSSNHPQGLIAIYKAWLQMLYDKKCDKFEQLCSDLLIPCDKFIEKIYSIIESLDINYSLEDLGIKSSQINFIAGSVKGNMQLDPIYQGVDTIKELLKKSL